MKQYFKPVIALLAVALLSISPVLAGTDAKMVIALKTDNLELTETDISDLEVGESRTVETDSGKIIDILRTPDGVEVYVDGELLEMEFDEPDLHSGHAMNSHVKIICKNAEDCDKDLIVLSGHSGYDVEAPASEDGEKIVIRKTVEISCTYGEADSNCSDEMVWTTEDGDMDLEELHQQHMDGGTQKIIVIKKEAPKAD